MSLGSLRGKKGSKAAGCFSCRLRRPTVSRNGTQLCATCAKSVQPVPRPRRKS